MSIMCDNIVGEYKIFWDKRLGSGTFSTVYMGEHIIDKFAVAIKVIDKNNSLTPRGIKLVDDEIAIIERIKDNNHENIVKFYDVIRSSSAVYIIMEYCDSGTLQDLFNEKILWKENIAQYYFYQLADGLKFLDGNKILHRDIKPANILLTKNMEVLKIADFGLAKFNNNSLHETMCGSPMYMAPEIIFNRPYNDKVDLWSLGMILYEMLFAFHPFQYCNSFKEVAAVAGEDIIEIPPPNTKNIVSNECLSLLKMLLKREAYERLTWEEFFSHSWINKYDYSEIHHDFYEVFHDNNNEEINIIDDFMDNPIKYSQTECLFPLEEDEEFY